MSELTKEQYDELPDYAKDAFVEDGDKYITVKDNKLKSTLDELDKKYKSQNSELDSIKDQLNQFKTQESEKIEAAKREVLEKAKKDGNNNEALELLQQELDDMRKRSSESESQYKQRIEDMTNSISSEKSSAIASDIIAEIGNVKGAKYLKKIVLERTKVDAETGKVTFLDESGGATSLDKAGFIAELKKDEDIHPLLKADIVTNGGGLANGSNGHKTSGSATNKAAQDAKDKGDLQGFLKASLNFNT